MTRLVEEDINTLIVNLKAYDGTLKQQTGMALVDIAMGAVGRKRPFRSLKVAVVPVTSGLGIIDGFSDTVCGILRYCGIDAYVTASTDVGGIQEAYRTGAEMIFMADDDVCSAFSVGSNAYSDNGYATGIGFAAALEIAMRERKVEKNVLVLGLGPVGRSAAEYLQQNGCDVWVYDTDSSAMDSFLASHPGVKRLEDSRDKSKFIYIYDATPVAHVIEKKDVTENTVIAAPGMPLGVDEDAGKIATVIHNPLELGILTMYCDCLKQMEETVSVTTWHVINGSKNMEPVLKKSSEKECESYGDRKTGKERTKTIYLQKSGIVSAHQ